MERDVGVLQRLFQRVEVTLSSSNPMEETNQFVRNRIFMEERDFFDSVEDDGGFKDAGVKRENSM